MKKIIIGIGTVISMAYHMSIILLCYALSKIGVMSNDRALLIELRHTEPVIDGIDKLYSLGYYDYYMTMEVRIILKNLIRALDDILA